MTTLLDEILELLGGPAPVKLTGSLTAGSLADRRPETPDPNPGGPCVDRVDRVDQPLGAGDGEWLRRGRFEVGRSYRVERIGRIFATSAADRDQLTRAGFVRAGLVELEGEVLLIDDVARAFVDGRFLVLGFADVAPRATATDQRGGRRK